MEFDDFRALAHVNGHECPTRLAQRPDAANPWKATLTRWPLGSLVCVVATVFVVGGALGCDGAKRRRIHSENVVKAEHFKREFDAHVPKGTTLTAVGDYLRSKPVKVQRSMGFHEGQDFVKELMIEVAAERSVNWYCGTASVGLMAQFDADRLTGNYVSSWSFDCP